MTDDRRRPAFFTLRALILLPLLFHLNAQQTPAASPFDARSPKFWELIDKNENVTKVAGGFGFTEGPVWDANGFLYVSDEVQNFIYKLFPDGRKEKLIALGDPDGNTYDTNHRLIDCASVLRAIIAVHPDGSYTILADHFGNKRFNSPNDVVLGPDGALYFTDPTLDLVKGEKQELPYQGVFRLDRDGRVTLLIDNLKQPNGIAFSPDGKRLYVDDSETKEIHAYAVTRHGTVDRGSLFAKEEGKGVPDGMRTDLQGNLYVTGPGGIWIWDSAGTQLGVVNVPEQPANLAWGDADLGTLYITAETSVYRLKTRANGFVPYLKHSSH